MISAENALLKILLVSDPQVPEDVDSSALHPAHVDVTVHRSTHHYVIIAVSLGGKGESVGKVV